MRLSDDRYASTYVSSLTLESGAAASIFLSVGAVVLLSGTNRGFSEAIIGAGVGTMLAATLAQIQLRPVFKRSISTFTSAPSEAIIEPSGRTVFRSIAKVGIPATVLAALILGLLGDGALGAFGEGLIGGLWAMMGLVLFAGVALIRQEEQKSGIRFVRAATLRPWGDWREQRSTRTWRFMTVPTKHATLEP